ncbi:MAG: beta-eliminating lyase-related protein [Myxococcota bacterium]
MRHLHGPGARKPADLLADAARWCAEHDIDFDVYGTGAVLTDFEARVAGLLGFEAARFMPSGILAQTVALRVWAERAGRPLFGMHPTSHVELHEERAYARLHGLHATLVGPTDRPMLARDLEAVVEPLSVVLTELPIREAGGQLPSWAELEALKSTAKDRRIPLHLDGARLWECGPAYGRSYAEICAGFSSVYVSFYKGIGALSGAMLLGDAGFIAEAAVWQRRQGGTLWSNIASIATAAMRLDEALAQMPAQHAHALAIGAALSKIPGVTLLPDPPQTCTFHVIGAMPPEQAAAARDRVAEETGIRAMSAPRPGPLPGTFRTELYIGTSALGIPVDEAADAWRRMMEPA